MDAIIFDKDGTLFDFQTTWSRWMDALIGELARRENQSADRISAALGYVSGHGFLADSVVIAGTSREVAETLAAETGLDPDEIEAIANRIGETTEQHPVPHLYEVLTDLRSRHVLGVVTNDGEAPARAHLASTGIEELFSFVAGYDSGHGAKPDPGPLLAFSRITGTDPARSLMVGDSRHDLDAGRAAGMTTVGVLTGVATQDDLADLADVVLPDISHLAAWIAARG